jgi:hypothetical protein
MILLWQVQRPTDPWLNYYGTAEETRNGENKQQPAVSDKTGLLNSIWAYESKYFYQPLMHFTQMNPNRDQ